MKSACQQVAQAGKDAAGLGAPDILRHRLGGDVEQRVAGKIAALGGQTLHRLGDQAHGAVQLAETVGLRDARHQLSRAPAAPGCGASRRPALASATANVFRRMAATRAAVGAIMTSSDASSGPS